MPDKIKIEINKSCAFTGNRDIEGKNIDGEKLKTLIVCLRGKGIKNFLCGMARGFDLYAAEKVIGLREEGLDIKLIACVPCENQDIMFSREDKIKYKAAINLCDEKIVISPHYYNGCMLKRNRFMVDNSCALIVFGDDGEEKTGGTGYTLNYALSSPNGKKREIYVV